MQLWGKINIFIFGHIIFNIPVGNAQAIQDKEVQKTIVDIHNDARRSVDPAAANMREMKWSDCLAEASYEYLEPCQKTQTVQEIAAAKDCEASDQDVGFSIFQGSEPILLPYIATIVRSWTNAQSYYNHEINQCELSCPHYVRMIFPESFLVGCAILDVVDCDSTRYFFLCSYAKGGGSYTQPYALGEKCSECMAPWDNCNDGLCTRNDGNSLFRSKTSSMIIFAIVFIFML